MMNWETLIEYHCCGEKNKDRIIYYIREDEPKLGFFAAYRHWLEYLYVADVRNYIPVIETGKGFAYAEPNVIHGTNNAFEYYFLQPGELSIADVQESANVVMSDEDHRRMVEWVLMGASDNYRFTDTYLQIMAGIKGRYVKYNDKTSEYIHTSMRDLWTDYSQVLGVHVRGTDFRQAYNGHPVYVTEEEYFESIDEMCKKNKYEKIFLATDDGRVLNNFVERYGEKLLFYNDTKRSISDSSVAFCEDERVNNRYLLGLEVLRDMETLSYCKGLIGGISQVVIATRINKMSRNEDFADIHIIDKGFYHNERNFVYIENDRLGTASEDKIADLKVVQERDKFLLFYGLLVRWIKIKQTGRTLAEYFERERFRSIAIYGFKELGALLYRELMGSSVRVLTIIDRNVHDLQRPDNSVEMITPDSNINAPIDTIVVTAVSSYREIKNNMEKNALCTIISLEEVLYCDIWDY